MKSFLKHIIRTLALRYGKFSGLYRRVCQPMGDEYADYLRRHGQFYAIGDKCSILPTTIFTDPAYVRIDKNVHFSSCTLIGHDEVVAKADLNRREGGFDPDLEPQMVQLRVAHFYGHAPLFGQEVAG